MVKKRLKRDVVAKIYFSLIFLFLYAPIFILIIYSFNSSKTRGKWGGFSLRWYVELFNDAQIMKSLYYTLAVAILASIIATVIGTMAAIAIDKMGKKSKSLIMNLTYIPVMNADIVTGIALMMVFKFLRMDLGFISLLIAHITFNIPYVILAVLPKLKQLDKNIYEAALDLGASPNYALFRVILPQIYPGIITGALLAFTLSLDDFVITFFTTGVPNLSITIYSMARRGIKPKINALSTLMFLAVLILLLIINYRTNKNNVRKENA